MLQNIREHIQGWFAGIIIVIIALSFILFGIESYLQADNPKLVAVAVVNGKKITAQQLQQRYHQLLEQTSDANALSDQARQELQQTALTQLIKEQALFNIAEDMGLVVSNAELKAFIMAMPVFQIDGHFSLQKFQQVLLANGLTTQIFEQQVRQMLLLTQLEKALRSGSFALPTELEQNYALLEQRRSFGYFEISNKNLAEKFQISKQDVQHYYEQHQEDFMLPEQVSISYVELSPAELAKTIKISEAEQRAYYQEHLNNFPKNKAFAELKPAILHSLQQEKAEALLAEKSEVLANLSFTNPDSLATIAKQLKLPIQHTALFDRKGAATGILSEPKLVQAAFSVEVLDENNNSEPIELKNGSLVVLRIKQHQPAHAQALKQVYSSIEAKLKAQQAQQQSYALAQKIEQALNEGTHEAELAKRYHLSWITKQEIALKDTSLPKPLVEAAFKIPFNGTNSKATLVNLGEGKYAVLQLTAQQWGSSAHLSEAESKDWLAQMAEEQATLEYQLYEKAMVKQSKLKLKKLPELAS